MGIFPTWLFPAISGVLIIVNVCKQEWLAAIFWLLAGAVYIFLMIAVRFVTSATVTTKVSDVQVDLSGDNNMVRVTTPLSKGITHGTVTRPAQPVPPPKAKETMTK